MDKVVVFGLQDFASLAHFYLKQEGRREVVAFAAHARYLSGMPSFEGVPTVAFEEVERIFPPAGHGFFAPMSYRRMNRFRAEIFADIRSKGYQMISYVHPTSCIAPGTRIGNNCFILENNTIQPFVTIGDNVMMWSGNQVSHHSAVRDHVFFGSQVAVSGHCDIGAHSFLGINSTVRENTRVAEGTLVAMGAAVTGDTDAWSVYRGVPARKAPGSSKDFDI